MSDLSLEPDDPAAGNATAVVFSGQRGVLQECGVKLAGDASLRPLLTICCQSMAMYSSSDCVGTWMG